LGRGVKGDAKSVISKDKKNLLSELIANIKELIPKEGTVHEAMQVFDLQQAPSKDDQKEYLDDNLERLRSIYDMFCAKTVLQYNSITDLAEQWNVFDLFHTATVGMTF